MFDAASPSRDGALPRARGAARVEFAAATGATASRASASAARRASCCRAPAGADAVAVLLNTAGGVCGGDRLEADAQLGPGARATVVGQAAERVYRALDRPATIRTRLEVAAAAVAPLGAAGDDPLRRRDARAADGAAAPRETRGSSRRRRSSSAAAPWASACARLHLRDDWRLWRDGAPGLGGLAASRGRRRRPALAAASGLRGHEALCTLVFVRRRRRGGAGGDPPRARRDAPVLGGASVVNGVLVARALGGGAAIRRLLTQPADDAPRGRPRLRAGAAARLGLLRRRR